MLVLRCCPGCRRPARSVCERCRSALQPWPQEIDLAARAATLGLDGLAVVFTYDALAARIVLAAKNGGRRDLLAGLGRSLASAGGGPIDAVTWVPASRAQARRRGFDQGRDLAAAAARPLGVRPRPLLRRARGEAQAGRSRAQRLVGPAVRCTTRCPPRVLLVDDVLTTGASLSQAAAALRGAGALAVRAAVVAAVP